MKKLTISILALLYIGILQAAGNSNVDALKWLLSANPATDATKALKNGDKRLRAVYGYTLFIPGTKPEKFLEYQKSYGINPIEGTSDFIESREHEKLNALAIEYAKQYNSFILKNGVK